MTSSLDYIALADGHLLVRADEMTHVLRQVAAVWLQTTDRGEADHDPATVLALAKSLMEVADLIDTECIALLPPEEPPEDARGTSG